MSRSILRIAVAAVFAAVVPAVAGAQTINCVRIGGVGGACPSAVAATFTVPTVHRLSMPDVVALEEPADWETFFQGSIPDTTFTGLTLTFRSNTAVAFGVQVSTPAALSGDAADAAGNTRGIADYAWKVQLNGACTANNYTAFVASATASVDGADLPAAAPQDASTRVFCIQSVYDPTDLTKLRAGTYQLDLTFAITAP